MSHVVAEEMVSCQALGIASNEPRSYMFRNSTLYLIGAARHPLNTATKGHTHEQDPSGEGGKEAGTMCKLAVCTPPQHEFETHLCRRDGDKRLLAGMDSSWGLEPRKRQRLFCRSQPYTLGRVYRGSVPHSKIEWHANTDSIGTTHAQSVL